ncbi:MAG: CPBP family intramembrane metalloprotease [Firmicutes bacterium]|nr:CPBP family intramembrane metalloprotease [Bacillota bacterium]
MNTAFNKWPVSGSPGVAGAVAVLVSSLLGSVAAFLLMGMPNGPEVAWAQAMGTMVGLSVALVLFARTHHVSLWRALSLSLPRGSDLRVIGPAYLAFLVALAYPPALSCLVDLPARSSPFLEKAVLSPVFWFDALLLGPLVEEIALRGFLFDWLLRRGPVVAVAVSAAVGALVHLDVSQVLHVWPMQAVLSYVRLRTQGVGACVLLHVLYNTLSSLLGLCLGPVLWS